MKKNKTTFLKSLLLALSAVFFVSGCKGTAGIEGIRMSNPNEIVVPYGSFSYENVNVTVDYKDGSTKEIPLEEEMISEVERLKFFKMGKHDVEVNLRKRFTTKMPINVVLNKFKDSYALDGYECVYDGLPHTVQLNQELPEGATLTFPYGNVFINAGVYEIIGVMEKNGYESKTLTTTLTIHQAERDADSIAFEDTTVIYNGEIRTIEATNVPEGVEVTYDTYDYDKDIRINKVVNVGKYRVVAHFNDTSTNYKKIEDKVAILTIEKANYDLSNVKLNSVTKEYDGLEYEAKIENESSLPMGISVQYRYYSESGLQVNSNAPAGKYTIEARFVGGDINNYNPIEPLRATLTVSKRVIKISEHITFESKNVNFNEEIHHLEISGALPSGVEVTYENNDQKWAGEYEVTAKFKATNSNEAVDVDTMVAYLIINQVRRSVLVYNTETEKYDLAFSEKNIDIVNGEIVISGYDTEVFRVASAQLFTISSSDPEPIDPADLVNHTTYKYVIIFEYLDPGLNQSIILANESDNFTYVEA